MTPPTAAAPMRSLTCALMLMLAPWAAFAQGRLESAEMTLRGVPQQVIQTTWEGGPATMILARPLTVGPGESPLPQLILLRLRDGALLPLADWPTPAALRWVEPIALPDGGRGWFGLIGRQWYLGELEQGELKWNLLCSCDSVFTSGTAKPPSESRFVLDLNNDGIDEVLLPERRGLSVYRQHPSQRRLIYLWQDRWSSREKYENDNGKIKVTIQLPRHIFADVDANGVIDLVQIRDTGLSITLHQWPAQDPQGSYYFIDGENTSDFADLKFSPEFKRALKKLPRRNYRTREDFQQALLKDQPPDVQDRWRKYLPAVTKIARVPVPMRSSYSTELPSLGKRKKGEGWKILDVTEMNGDGVIDVIHHKGIDTSDIFEQKNQLRLYSGRHSGNRLSFHPKPKLFFTEGPAFAEIAPANVDPRATPTLFLATMEVSLFAVIRAFTMNSITLDAFIYPWREGKVWDPAPTHAALSFSMDVSKKNSRPMLLLADLDADGWREYIFNLEPDKLFAFKGTPRGAIMGGNPMVTGEIQLPRKREESLTADLDGRPGEELFFWYPSKRLSRENRRLVRAVWYTRQPVKRDSEAQEESDESGSQH